MWKRLSEGERKPFQDKYEQYCCRYRKHADQEVPYAYPFVNGQFAYGLSGLADHRQFIVVPVEE